MRVLRLRWRRGGDCGVCFVWWTCAAYLFGLSLLSEAVKSSCERVRVWFERVFRRWGSELCTWTGMMQRKTKILFCRAFPLPAIAVYLRLGCSSLSERFFWGAEGSVYCVLDIAEVGILFPPPPMSELSCSPYPLDQTARFRCFNRGFFLSRAGYPRDIFSLVGGRAIFGGF